MHMLFSTNIFIWTAVSCNCSEGTAASDYPLSWDGKSYFQVGHGSAEQTICNLRSLGCATPVGMPAGQCRPTLGSRQKPPGCSPCQCPPVLSPACGVNCARLRQVEGSPGHRVGNGARPPFPGSKGSGRDMQTAHRGAARLWLR